MTALERNGRASQGCTAVLLTLQAKVKAYGAFLPGILHLPVFLLTIRPSSHLPPGPGSSPSFWARLWVVIIGTATATAPAPTSIVRKKPRRLLLIFSSDF